MPHWLLDCSQELQQLESLVASSFGPCGTCGSTACARKLDSTPPAPPSVQRRVLAASRAAAHPPALSSVRIRRAAQAPGHVQQAGFVYRVGTAYPGLSYTPAPFARSPGQELQGKQTLGQSGGSQAAQSAAGTDCAGSHTWSARDEICASLPCSAHLPWRHRLSATSTVMAASGCS